MRVAYPHPYRFGDTANEKRTAQRRPITSIVTIAIGIISKQTGQNDGAIILATDSQTTYLGGKSKDLDTIKIHEIQFADGRILIADSGCVPELKVALGRIEDRAQTVKIENWESVKDLIDETLNEYRQELTKGHNFDADRYQSYLRFDVWFEFLIAFYSKGKPYLLQADIYKCNARPVERQFSAIGTGDDLATYLLKQYQEADPDFVFAENIAIAAIEKVKANVNGCSGPTQIGIVWPMDDTCAPIIQEPAIIAAAANEIRKSEREMLPQQREMLIKSIHNTWGGQSGKEVAAHLKEKLNQRRA